MAEAGMISMAGPVLAQTAGSAGKNTQADPLIQIQEVVVTARRRE
jgi:hypothetical protein